MVSLDFREVLRHAWQITWKYKTLWFFGALPVIPILFYLPLIFYFFLSDNVAERIPDLITNPTFIVLFFIALLMTVAMSLGLQVFGRAAITFGLNQIEAGNDRPSFAEISKGAGMFFWRTLGVILLASLAITVAFAVFSGCLSLVGLATFGLGSLMGQLLFFPVSLLAYAVLEQSQAAVVADAMSPVDAIRRAWELVMENVNLFAPLTIVLYVGLSAASTVALLPVMAPLLLAVLGRFSGEFSHPAILWIGITCFAIYLPVYLLFQAIALLYMRSVHVITYLRLTRSLQLQPLPGNREATS